MKHPPFFRTLTVLASSVLFCFVHLLSGQSPGQFDPDQYFPKKQNANPWERTPEQLGEPEAFVDYELSGSEWIVHSDLHAYGISRFGDGIIRVRWLENGEDWSENSPVVVMEPGEPDLKSENNDEVRFGTGHLELVVRKDPLQFEYYWKDELIIAEETGFYRDGMRPGVRFHLDPAEHIDGTGSRAIPVNRNGRSLAFYNQPRYGYSGDEPLLNINIPFLTSSRGYGLYFENNTPTLADLGESEPGIFTYEAYAGNLSYCVVAGDGYDEILDRYTDLSGKQPLPPRWALGYIQSRFGYRNEAEARQIVQDFLIEDFPLDALVIDLYWFGDQSVMGDLDWDRSRFPDPEQMISDFQQHHIKTIIISEPYVTTLSDNFANVVVQGLVGKKPGGGHYVIDNFWAGPAVLLDMTKEEAQDWLKDKYRARLDEGIAGWWSDLGEPELHPDDMEHEGGNALEVHNIYSNLWMEVLEDAFREKRPDERLFNLIRSGYAGMQRYSTFPWSGDVARNFEGLRSQVPIMLGMGMSGVGYMGSDVGGFTGDVQPELSVRWFQQATYSPVMRAHGVGDAPEPVYLPEPHRNIVRDYLKLRYRMLPYNQTLAYLNTTTGRPLALPMHYFEPDNPALQNIDDQYFWGEDLIIAPVMEEDARSRSVRLPEGRWYHSNTNVVYNGGQSVQVDAPLESIPVFIRSGAVIPNTPEMNNTEDYSQNYVIHYYPDPDDRRDTFLLFEDVGLDAHTLANMAYHTYLIEADRREDEKFEIGLANLGPLHFTGEVDPIPYQFIIHHVTQAPGRVLLGLTEFPQVASRGEFEISMQAAFWDMDEEVLYVKTHAHPAGIRITVENLVTAVATTKSEVRNIRIYPNPGQHEIRIELDFLLDEKDKLLVYDVEGRQISVLQPVISRDKSAFTWNSSGQVRPGTYFLRLTNEKGSRDIGKVIVGK